MNKISFGIVGIFGILMPGALLLVNIFFPLSAMHNSLDWFKGNAADYKMDTVIIIVLILLAFTAGTVLRTLPPRSAEWLYRRFSKWDFYSVLRAYLEKPKREHFSSIPDDVWDKHYNPEEVAEKRKHWRHMRLFNFSKNYVIANSERLAREVQTAEGLSRFMASVFWCSLVGVVISGYSFLNILDSDKSSDCLNIAIYFILANSLLFIGSARGVGTIREHEGEVVMQSFFCLHLSNKKDINNDEKV
jgi:hypothetical protein